MGQCLRCLQGEQQELQTRGNQALIPTAVIRPSAAVTAYFARSRSSRSAQESLLSRTWRFLGISMPNLYRSKDMEPATAWQELRRLTSLKAMLPLPIRATPMRFGCTRPRHQIIFNVPITIQSSQMKGTVGLGDCGEN